MSEKSENLRSVSLHRVAQSRYTATNAAGASVTFGHGEDVLSPVELLLAALGGCTAIDVDVVTSRREEPDAFRVDVTAEKIIEEGGANRLENLDVAFHLRFPDTDAGRQAASMVERVAALSHDKHCTVSRTIEAGPTVSHSVDAGTTQPSS